VGGLMFFAVAGIIIAIVYHFLSLYSNGLDYTVSHQRLIDLDLDKVDPNIYGDLSQGLTFITGKNFKYAIAFYKKDHYYPFNVSQYMGPIGIRVLQYTINKNNGIID
jgi:hypothetical protein